VAVDELVRRWLAFDDFTAACATDPRLRWLEAMFGALRKARRGEG
jgi:hypothetical protein